MLNELRGTQVWLALIARVPFAEVDHKVGNTLGESEQMIAIFVRTVQTARRKDLEQHRPGTRDHLEHF